MRKVILFVQVSVDGFFEGPKEEIDWNMVDDEIHAHIIEEIEPMGAFLNGRVTCELMAGFWPTADADPGSTPFVKEFARIWRDMPKVVYSKTLTSAGGTRRSSGTSCGKRSKSSRHLRVKDDTTLGCGCVWGRDVRFRRFELPL
jgi:RibD C-terminal domain